jgi:hypothetical protein
MSSFDPGRKTSVQPLLRMNKAGARTPNAASAFSRCARQRGYTGLGIAVKEVDAIKCRFP